MRPIPRRYLTSDALVRVPLDGTRGGRFAEPVALSGVCWQASVNVQEGHVVTVGEGGTLYVDAVNTAGAFAIPAGSKVSVDGGETWLTATAVAQQPPFGPANHWEVTLS